MKKKTEVNDTTTTQNSGQGFDLEARQPLLQSQAPSQMTVTEVRGPLTTRKKQELFEEVRLKFDDKDSRNQQMLIAAMQLACVSLVTYGFSLSIEDRNLVKNAVLGALVALLIASLQAPLAKVSKSTKLLMPKAMMDNALAKYTDNVEKFKQLQAHLTMNQKQRMRRILDELHQLVLTTDAKNPAKIQDKINELNRLFDYVTKVLEPTSLTQISPQYSEEVLTAKAEDLIKRIDPAIASLTEEDRNFIIGKFLQPLIARVLIGTNVQLPHLLLVGPPSSGKSTFLQLVSDALEIPTFKPRLTAFVPNGAAYQSSYIFDPNNADLITQAIAKAKELGAKTIIVSLDELKVVLEEKSSAPAGKSAKKEKKKEKEAIKNEEQEEEITAKMAKAPKGAKNVALLEYFLELLGTRTTKRPDHYLDLELDTGDITIIFVAACNAPFENEALASRFHSVSFPKPDPERLAQIIINDINQEIANLAKRGIMKPPFDSNALKVRVEELIQQYNTSKPDLTSRQISPLIVHEIVYGAEVSGLFKNTSWRGKLKKP